MTRHDKSAGEAPDWVRALNDALSETAMVVRGAFHPDDDDSLVAPAYRPANTIVLVGNAGNDLWHAFQATGPDMAQPHPLDRWVKRHLGAAADRFGARLVDPMKPPYPPVQQWAERAGAGFRSPINLIIHPVYGLWHTFRGALVFAERLPLPERAALENPCDTCPDKPCLTACPAHAFTMPAGAAFADFSADACVDHVAGAHGKPCRTVGCLARRACPVGKAWSYDREPAAYHMAAVVRTVRAWQAKAGAADS